MWKLYEIQTSKFMKFHWNTAMPIYVYAFTLQRQSWVAETDTSLPAKVKIFTEKFCQPVL